MAVAARTPDFLVEAVERGWHASMKDRAHIRLIHPESESSRPDYHVHGGRLAVTRPVSKDPKSLVISDISVERNRATEPLFLQPGAELFRGVLLGRVHDDRPGKMV